MEQQRRFKAGGNADFPFDLVHQFSSAPPSLITPYTVFGYNSIIDQIDCVSAEHYGLTDEELDFIINYDIKYRMGRGSVEEEE